MIKYWFALLSFFFLTHEIFSQEYTISGAIADETNQPISYANIILIRASDSIVYKGTSSNENGKFIFNDVKADSYTLHITFVGFKDYTQALLVDADGVLDTIHLEETTEALDEIEIIAKKPTLKKEQDRLVFNIENTTLTEGSIWDVLKGTPGILMINDEITVKNSSNIIYLINDKRVYLSDHELQQLLSGTNANAVQSVEVITNPPAKYDASGGAVINIKMSKNLVTGYNGNLYGNYTQGVYPRYNIGTGHFFKKDKLSVFLNYSYDYSKVNRVNKEDMLFIEANAVTGRWQGDIDRNTKSKTHNASLNLDYDLDEKNTLSLSASTTQTPFWKQKTNSVTQAIDSTFVSLNGTEDHSKNWAFNLGFQNTSEKGNVFSTNFNYTFNDYERFQNVMTDYFDASDAFLRNNSFEAHAIQDINIFTGQADYSMTFENEGTLDFGGKLSVISVDNNFQQYLINTNVFTQDIDNSGIFDYSENIYAGYLSYAKSSGKWDYSLGIRAEYTQATGDLVGVQTNDFDYLKWFPTLSMTYNLNEKHSFGLSYNKRIERPAYSDLNPFQFYLNDNTYVVGNPNLKPTISQTTTFSYTLNQTFTFEIYYRYGENPITELTFLDNENNKVRYQATNLKQEIDYGFDFLTYTTLTNFWSVYVVNSIFHDQAQFFAEESGNSIEENNRWSMYSNVVNYFNLDKKQTFNAELSLLYISPIVDGSAEASSRTQVDLSLKKSFKDGTWIASLTANDIFGTTDFTVKNNYLNQRNKYYAKFDNQWIRLGLRYNFGNTKLKANQSTSSQAEQDRIKTRD